jgi:hypothetical protein
MNNYLKVFIFILILFNLVYIYKNRVLNNELNQHKLIIQTKNNINEIGKTYLSLKDTLIPISNNSSIKDYNYLRSKPYSLIVLFDPTNCGSCLGESVLWNEIYADGKINIIGITNIQDTSELNTYIKNAGINIPVFQDKNSYIYSWISPAKVPMKILIDNNLNILSIDYIREGQEQRTFYKKSIYFYLNID